MRHGRRPRRTQRYAADAAHRLKQATPYLWDTQKSWSDLQIGVGDRDPPVLPRPSLRRGGCRAAWCWRLPPGCSCAICTAPSR
uniref:Mlo2 n=1 Tax=Arundo donax TaxID=35708 RepID=A0A0A9G1S0_ARUDO